VLDGCQPGSRDNWKNELVGGPSPAIRNGDPEAEDISEDGADREDLVCPIMNRRVGGLAMTL
jgi:hypothetical protein